MTVVRLDAVRSYSTMRAAYSLAFCADASAGIGCACGAGAGALEALAGKTAAAAAASAAAVPLPGLALRCIGCAASSAAAAAAESALLCVGRPVATTPPTAATAATATGSGCAQKMQLPWADMRSRPSCVTVRQSYTCNAGAGEFQAEMETHIEAWGMQACRTACTLALAAVHNGNMLL